MTSTLTASLPSPESTLTRTFLRDQAVGDQLVDTDGAALRERLGDVADVHHAVPVREPVAGSPSAWAAACGSASAALEGHWHVLAGLGALWCRGLAVLPLSPHRDRRESCLLRAGSRLWSCSLMISLIRHLFYFTRWWTVLMRPRVCGLSSRTTDWRILRRPGAQVSRCFQRAPMTPRTCDLQIGTLLGTSFARPQRPAPALATGL